MISVDRILVTHAGSLPRPRSLRGPAAGEALRAAVRAVVRDQRAAGVDVVSDGECSRDGYTGYVTGRLSGFGGRPRPARIREFEGFPEFAAETTPALAPLLDNTVCDGPVHLDLFLVNQDIANLVEVAKGARGRFLTTASPGLIAMLHPNGFYPTSEAYLYAVADAMKNEYDAIAAAGLVLQLDCPDLARGWLMGPARPLGEYRREVALRLEVLDYATRDIPPGQLRIHVCWGNFEAPHTADLPLRYLIDLVLAARPAAVSFEAASPGHAHEWQDFEDIPVPEGKILIPGVVDTTTNNVERPELVAQRLDRYARYAGPQNVMAGTDCGFASVRGYARVDPRVARAKLAALADGAGRASSSLMGWVPDELRVPRALRAAPPRDGGPGGGRGDRPGPAAPAPRPAPGRGGPVDSRSGRDLV